MADSAEANKTCVLLRDLADSLLHQDDHDGDDDDISTFGRLAAFDRAKYLLTDVINPALCVVRFSVTCRTRLTHLVTSYFHFRSGDGPGAVCCGYYW